MTVRKSGSVCYEMHITKPGQSFRDEFYGSSKVLWSRTIREYFSMAVCLCFCGILCERLQDKKKLSIQDFRKDIALLVLL